MGLKRITGRVQSGADGSADFSFDMITLRFNKNWTKFERIGNVNVYRVSSLENFS